MLDLVYPLYKTSAFPSEEAKKERRRRRRRRRGTRTFNLDNKKLEFVLQSSPSGHIHLKFDTSDKFVLSREVTLSVSHDYFQPGTSLDTIPASINHDVCV